MEDQVDFNKQLLELVGRVASELTQIRCCLGDLKKLLDQLSGGFGQKRLRVSAKVGQ